MAVWRPRKERRMAARLKNQTPSHSPCLSLFPPHTTNRKVAIPVPQSMQWDEFVTEVSERESVANGRRIVKHTFFLLTRPLSLPPAGRRPPQDQQCGRPRHGGGECWWGCGCMERVSFFSSSRQPPPLPQTGARVSSLDTLQDIDELHVLDVGAPSTSADTASLLGGPRASGRSSHRVAAADTEITPADGAYASPFDVGGGGGDDDDKYGPRSGAAARALARLFPALVPAASLPLTRHDVDGRRGRGSARARAPLPPARARRRARALFVLLLGAAAVLLIINRWGARGLAGLSFGGGLGGVGGQRR